MQEHDAEYCEFRELKAVVVTWNAGATTPTSLRYEDRNNNFFREVIQIDSPPDILVFGFQELVDLDDKRLTASEYVYSLYHMQLTLCRKSFQREQKERLFGTRAHEPSI